MDTMTPQTDPTTIKVNLPGGASVKIEFGDDTTVRDVLMLAATKLGVNLVPEHVTAIVDEQEIDLDDQVPEGARDVHAAPNAANG